ncbi:MAG: hypothetical protein OEY14_03050 [Myxococcales bacterium]|nr:hypothetical protein [Myxococcales bacterium]
MSSPKGKRTYLCPHCGQKLSFLDGTVIKLVGRLHAEHFSCKTMVYVPAELGRYGLIVGEGVRVREGARFELECINAACKRSFTAAYDDDLAEIKMVDETGRSFVVAFDRVYGSRATFLVDLEEDALVQTWGEHTRAHHLDFDKKLNFFGC